MPAPTMIISPIYYDKNDVVCVAVKNEHGEATRSAVLILHRSEAASSFMPFGVFQRQPAGFLFACLGTLGEQALEIGGRELFAQQRLRLAQRVTRAGAWATLLGAIGGSLIDN